MKKLEDVGVLVARILMPILFIVAGWGKITGYAGTQQYMEAMGVPGFLLPLTILLEFGGGLAVLFGFLTRTTALFTAGFTVLTAFLFHSNFAEGVKTKNGNQGYRFAFITEAAAGESSLSPGARRSRHQSRVGPNGSAYSDDGSSRLPSHCCQPEPRNAGSGRCSSHGQTDASRQSSRD